MEDLTLREYLKERLDKIDDDNNEIKTDLKSISATVMQHSTYWGIARWVLVSGGGIGAAILSYFGLHPSSKS